MGGSLPALRRGTPSSIVRRTPPSASSSTRRWRAPASRVRRRRIPVAGLARDEGVPRPRHAVLKPLPARRRGASASATSSPARAPQAIPVGARRGKSPSAAAPLDLGESHITRDLSAVAGLAPTRRPGRPGREDPVFLTGGAAQPPWWRPASARTRRGRRVVVSPTSSRASAPHARRAAARSSHPPLGPSASNPARREHHCPPANAGPALRGRQGLDAISVSRQQEHVPPPYRRILPLVVRGCLRRLSAVRSRALAPRRSRTRLRVLVYISGETTTPLARFIDGWISGSCRRLEARSPADLVEVAATDFGRSRGAHLVVGRDDDTEGSVLVSPSPRVAHVRSPRRPCGPVGDDRSSGVALTS